MKIKEAQEILKLGWEITRKKWGNKKFLVKKSNSPVVDINENGKLKKYVANYEDSQANDWEIYTRQSNVIPSLTE